MSWLGKTTTTATVRIKPMEGACPHCYILASGLISITETTAVDITETRIGKTVAIVVTIKATVVVVDEVDEDAEAAMHTTKAAMTAREMTTMDATLDAGTIAAMVVVTTVVVVLVEGTVIAITIAEGVTALLHRTILPLLCCLALQVIMAHHPCLLHHLQLYDCFFLA